MADRLRIFPLLRSQLQFSVSEPTFEPLAALELGDHATERDGFDAELLGVVQSLESEANLLAAADADLAEADFKPGEFAAHNIDPLLADAGAFTAAGNSLIDDLDGSTAPPGTSTPPTLACQPTTPGYALPITVDLIIPGENEVGLGQVYSGNCSVLRRIVPTKNRTAVFVKVRSARLVSGDAAIVSVAVNRTAPDGPPHDEVRVIVKCDNVGTVSGNIEIVEQGTGNTALLKASLLIVAVASAPAPVQSQFFAAMGA